MSVKTISKIEHGEPVFVATLTLVASALEVPCPSLVKTEERVGPSSPRTSRKRLILILPDDFAEFDHHERLQRLIAELVAAAGEQGVDVLKIEGGSTAITIEVSADGAARILKAFNEGRLGHLNIEEIVEVASAPMADVGHGYHTLGILSMPKETEDDFRKRLTRFWTSLLRNQPDIYEDVYAEARHFGQIETRVSRHYIVNAYATDTLIDHLTLDGLESLPPEVLAEGSLPSAPSPDWVILAH